MERQRFLLKIKIDNSVSWSLCSHDPNVVLCDINPEKICKSDLKIRFENISVGKLFKKVLLKQNQITWSKTHHNRAIFTRNARSEAEIHGPDRTQTSEIVSLVSVWSSFFDFKHTVCIIVNFDLHSV